MVEQAQMGKYKICREKAPDLAADLSHVRTIEFNTIPQVEIGPVNAAGYLFDMINARVEAYL